MASSKYAVRVYVGQCSPWGGADAGCHVFFVVVLMSYGICMCSIHLTILDVLQLLILGGKGLGLAFKHSVVLTVSVSALASFFLLLFLLSLHVC